MKKNGEGTDELKAKAPTDYLSDDDSDGSATNGRGKGKESRPGEDEEDWKEYASEMKAEKKEKALNMSKAERESSVGAVEGDFSGL